MFQISWLVIANYYLSQINAMCLPPRKPSQPIVVFLLITKYFLSSFSKFHANVVFGLMFDLLLKKNITGAKSFPNNPFQKSEWIIKTPSFLSHFLTLLKNAFSFPLGIYLLAFAKSIKSKLSLLKFTSINESPTAASDIQHSFVH